MTAEVAITGTNTYAGVECYTTEVRIDGKVRYTACLSPRLGLVVHSAVTPEGKAGEQSAAFELVEYDGRWAGTITVTTAEGRSHQAFTGDGDRTIAVDSRLDVDPRDVRSITATAEKQAGDDRTLRIAIRKNGDVVAEASTDAPRGDTVASHHE